MKMLVISNMYPSKSQPSYGIFIKNFYEGLVNEGWEIQLSVIKGRGRTIFQKIFKYFCFIVKTISLGLFKNYDFVYVHYLNHSLIPVLLIALLKPKVKFVFNAHGGDIFPESKFGESIQKTTQSLIKRASLIVVPSQYFKEVLLKKFNINEFKVFISPSAGIDLSIFKPKPKLRNKKEDFNIGYVGRIDEGKGWEIVIQALKILNQRLNRSIKLTIVGGGKQLEKLFEMIQNNQLDSYVQYEGQVKQIDLPQIYNHFDVFVFPTYRAGESLGLVGLEAMSCGIPVIASNMGGPGDYIKDGYNGFKFEPKNINHLVDTLFKFIELPNNCKLNLSEGALETSKEFDRQKIIVNLSNKLKTILN